MNYNQKCLCLKVVFTYSSLFFSKIQKIHAPDFFFVWPGKGAHQDDNTVVKLMEFLHGGNFVSKIGKFERWFCRNLYKEYTSLSSIYTMAFIACNFIIFNLQLKMKNLKKRNEMCCWIFVVYVLCKLSLNYMQDATPACDMTGLW